MKTFLKILGIAAAVIVLAVAGFTLVLNNGMGTAKNLQIGAATPAGLSDGAYEGAFEGGRFTNSVVVDVKDGKIQAIRAVKTVTFDKPETTNALFDSVIAAQSTDVDVVSGATLTSKAYLKSIETALESK